MELIIKILAIWGGLLSTILVMLQLWEKYCTRIDVGCDLSGLSEIGNTITIRNISDKALFITYWELQFRKREGFRWKVYKTIDPEDDRIDIVIQSHSSQKFVFRDEHYFNRDYKYLSKKRLYFKIHSAGKKLAKTFLIYKG